MLKGRFCGAKDKFKSYKNAQRKLCPIDLSGISVPCTKGLVSVVLPVKDGEKYIKESIISVLNQDYQDFELIIVDDGSLDSTPQIISELADENERITIITQENKGLPTALNKGFEAAHGEYLTWTSADNIADTDWLSTLVGEMEASPNTAMVFGNMRLIDHRGKLIRGHGWYEFPVGSGNVKLPCDINSLNIIANNTIGAAFMYRKSAAEIIGGYSPYRFGTEDYDYWMRFNELFEIKHIKESKAIYSYRMHSESLTSRDEELSITKDRYKLMVFDDFRRDFLLSQIPVCIKGAPDSALEIFKKSGIIPVEKDKAMTEISLSDSNICGEDIKNLCLALGLRERSRLMSAIEERCERASAPTKKLTVAICTDGKADTLFESAMSVIEQMDDDTELLLIDNAPCNKRCREVYEALPKKNIRYIISPILGLSYARNTALYNAEGEIILYLDDDSIAEENLLYEITNAFKEHPQAGVIGGEIKLHIPPEYKGLVAKYGGGLWSEFLINSDEYTLATKANYPYGACFGVRRKLLYITGGFPTSFGRRGEDFGGGEELYVCNMAEKAGFNIGLCPKAGVIHKVDSGRFTAEHARRTKKSAKRTLKRLNFFFT